MATICKYYSQLLMLRKAIKQLNSAFVTVVTLVMIMMTLAHDNTIFGAIQFPARIIALLCYNNTKQDESKQI